MPPKTSPKVFIEADCAFAAIAERSILAAGVLVEDEVIDALDVILSVGVALPVTVVVGVPVEVGVCVFEAVLDAVEPVERDAVGVGLGVVVPVPVGVGVAAATSEKVVGEVSV